MPNADEHNAPARAKAALIEPESMTVLWMNESALQDYPDEAGDFVPGTPVAEAIPLAELLGVPAALRCVADTGDAQHLNTGLVSTAKGSMTIVTSIHRMPDGKLLLLMEHAWQAEKSTTGAGRSRRSGRRGR